MPKFSISLPSLRADYLQATIGEIYRCSKGFDYEIIVVSPFCAEGDRIVWVKEDKPAGACTAHVRAYEAASGEIMLTLTDDVAPTPGWLYGLEDYIRESEKLFFPFCGGLHWADRAAFGSAYGLYYPYFPVITRESIEAIGGFFSTCYASICCDIDMGLRTWDAGGRCEPLLSSVVYRTHQEDEARNSEHKNTLMLEDSKEFFDRWRLKMEHRLPHKDAHVQIDLHVGHAETLIADWPNRMGGLCPGQKEKGPR